MRDGCVAQIPDARPTNIKMFITFPTFPQRPDQQEEAESNPPPLTPLTPHALGGVRNPPKNVPEKVLRTLTELNLHISLRIR